MKTPKNHTSAGSQPKAQTIKAHGEQTAPDAASEESSDRQDETISEEPDIAQTLGRTAHNTKHPDSFESGGSSNRNIVYGTVTKSWTSGGVGGTGATRAGIIATYFVSKNLENGATNLVGTTFSLTFFDIDNQTTSTIPAYAFAFRGKTQIPQPEDGGDFDLNGTVSVLSESSGRLLLVDFDMSGTSPPDGGSTPKISGSIFILDIPQSTTFSPSKPLVSA